MKRVFEKLIVGFILQNVFRSRSFTIVLNFNGEARQR